MNATAHEKARRFRALHAEGCFVLPNPWDVGSAILLEHLGYQALATTSAGMGFSRGASDRDGAIPRDAVLAHLREIVAATSLPVNADFMSGYAADAEGVEASVTLCVETGVAGLSIEDSTGDEREPLHPLDRALDRVRAARRAIDASGVPVVFTARCEAWLVGAPRPVDVAIERLRAYAEAGADCLYAPGVTDLSEISALVRAVSPKPINILVSAHSPALTVPALAKLGVRRISVGSALSRVAYGAFLRSAREILETGSFEAFSGAASFRELNGVFGAHEKPSAGYN